MFVYDSAKTQPCFSCCCCCFFLLLLSFFFAKVIIKRFHLRDAKHIVQLSVLVLMFLDIAIYTGLYESDISSVRFAITNYYKQIFIKMEMFGELSKVRCLIRWSRPLRPLLLVNIPEGRQIRRAFRNIRRYFPSFRDNGGHHSCQVRKMTFSITQRKKRTVNHLLFPSSSIAVRRGNLIWFFLVVQRFLI